MVIWITGLPGAGKTTVAKKLVEDNSIFRKKPIILDGDEIRSIIHEKQKNLYDRDSRLSLAYKYAGLANLLSEQGHDVIVATISLFSEIHKWNRNNISEYFEIYLKVPREELEKRDQKKLYSRYKDGKINNIAGLDIAVDFPSNANCVVDFKIINDLEKSIKFIKEAFLKSICK
jgi:cytidine diphosphoramidate kinase